MRTREGPRQDGPSMRIMRRLRAGTATGEQLREIVGKSCGPHISYLRREGLLQDTLGDRRGPGFRAIWGITEEGKKWLEYWAMHHRRQA